LLTSQHYNSTYIHLLANRIDIPNQCNVLSKKSNTIQKYLHLETEGYSMNVLSIQWQKDYILSALNLETLFSDIPTDGLTPAEG